MAEWGATEDDMTTATDLSYFTIPTFHPLPSGYVAHLDTLAYACQMAHRYGRPEVYEVTPSGAVRAVAVMAVVR